MPYLLTEEQIEAMRQALVDVGATSPCVRCKSAAWRVQPDLVQLPIEIKEKISETVVIPCVTTVCARCGLVSLHSFRELTESALRETGASPPPSL